MHIPQALTTHRRIPNRLGVLALVVALAAGLLAGSGSAAAQTGKPDDRPLHPLSQKGLIPPVYLLRPDEVAEVVRTLNTNSGLWNAYQVTPSGSSSEVLAVADFTGDAKADVALATDPGVNPQDDEKVHWFQWRSTAELVRFAQQSAAQFPRGMAAGDLDGDKTADIVVADNNHSRIGIFYQTAPGQFSAMQTVATGSDPNSVAIGDFNDDGRPDVAVAHGSAFFISVFLQQADGTLSSATTIAVGGGATNDLAAGDLDNDGDDDLALIRGSGFLNAEIALFYQATGALQPPVYRNAQDYGYSAHAAAIGDVTGDGRADLVVGVGGNVPLSKLNLFVQQGDGTLPATPQIIDAYHMPSAIEIADVNQDGRSDVAALHDGFPAITLYLQQANGALAPYEAYPLPAIPFYHPQALALADVTGDGGVDAIIADNTTGLLLLTNRRPVGVRLARTVSGSGGGTGKSSSFRLSGVLGQPVLGEANTLGGGAYRIQPGFLSAWASRAAATPPETTITSAPPDPNTSSTATFSFSASQTGSAFLCQMDGLDFAPCTSPHSATSLGEGRHRFRVKAVNAAGQIDLTAASHAWSVLQSPPDTTIETHPADPTTSTSATFTFSASQGNCTFECSLNSSGFASCTSPKTYNGLGEGSHTFQVRARNQAGMTDPTPASFSWTIQPLCYTLALSVNPPASGSVSRAPAPDCNGGTQYRAGTIVQLTANAAAGYSFSSWTGDVNGSANPTTVTMAANKTATAHFVDQVSISGVRVTNLRARSFSVTWLTDLPAGGQVRYGTVPAALSQTAFDDRGAAISDDTHHVTLSGLQPSTTYYFDVVSGQTVDDNGGSHYTATTGPELAPPASDTAFGQVFKQNGTSFAGGAIVYVSVHDADGQGAPGQSNWLSELVSESDGYWFLNLAEARTPNNAAYFAYSLSGDRTVIEVEGAADCQASLTVDTTDDSPVAAITLSCLQQATIGFSPGWNLLALPLNPVSAMTAQSLLDAINGQGGSCNEIDRWHNGGWSAHVNGLPFNDFAVEAGKGYFLKCAATSQWTLDGHAFAAGIPVALQPGWNLIGVPHPASGYFAQSLLDAIASQGGVCGEIDRWLNGGWSAHVNGFPFNNFAMGPSAGYFVKCSQSSTFVPGPVAVLDALRAQPAPVEMALLPAATNPKIGDVLVTNRRDVALTVVWRTDRPSDGWVEYGPTDELGQVAYDGRGKKVVSAVHSVTLSGLQPETTYVFKVHSGRNNNGRLLEITTSAVAAPATPQAVYGQVLDDSSAPAVGSVVIARLEDSQRAQSEPLSALVDGWGYWVLNLPQVDCASAKLQLSVVSPAGEVVELVQSACR